MRANHILPLNLLKALAAVSSMTLLSRILGFVRDTIIARVFGAGLLTDAFFVAFKIPNLLRRLFAEGAFSQAFVPILAEYKNRKGHDATQTLVNQVGTALTLALVGVALLGVVGAPWVAYVSAPGFRADPDKFELTVTLLRIIFPYIIFISLVALAAGILNTHSKFSVPAFAPVLLNVAMIAAALWLAPYFDPPVLALGWGVALGGVLQLAWMLPHLLKIRMLPRPTRRFDDPGLKRVLKLMAPATLGVSVAQISLLINTIFASFLATGSVSWLYYADRLMEFPAGMLGVALGVGDHDDGVTGFMQFGEQLHDAVTGGGIEVAGWLIGQDHLRPVDERAGDGHPLLLPARKLGGFVQGAVGQANLFQQVHRPGAALAARHAGKPHGKTDVFGSVHGRHQVEGLENKAQIG